MKKYLIVFAIMFPFVACTKEQTTPKTIEPEVSASEIEALKKDIKDLQEKVAALTPGEDAPVVSVSEFEALKSENETLKKQVELLLSDFFEVDGLRFDKNGTLISVPRLESEVVEEVGRLTGDVITRTTKRTYDAEGRVIEIFRDHNTRSEWASIPYFWQKTLYEYTGKTCKTTTQTYKYGLPAGTPYEEVITQATYW